MKVLYFNCKSGISGDMVVGALLNILNDNRYLLEQLKNISLTNFSAEIKKVRKKKILATKFNVISGKEKKHRNLRDINKIIETSKLSSDVKKIAKKIFLNLGKAEAKVHNIHIDKIHFHDVGAVDSIIDILCSSILIDKIIRKYKIEKIYCSRISIGRGNIKFSHGTVILPVPAVKELLKKNPLQVLKINKELVTPTGAAIIKTLVNDFIDKTSIKIHKRGYGAGTRNLNVPNVLEVIIGDIKMLKNEKVILETNIDDMNPEFYEYIIAKLIKSGAREAFIQPVIMKKSRIGTLLNVICDEHLINKLMDIIFSETTTFGIRINRVCRVEIERKIKKVKTKYGIVHVNIGIYKGKIKTIAPEYEDYKKIAEKRNIPIKRVYEEIKKEIGIIKNHQS